jgi:hypothetical protein
MLNQICGEAAADQSAKLIQTSSYWADAPLSHKQDWRRLYFSAMTYVTAHVEKPLYTPLVIKTLLPTEEL